MKSESHESPTESGSPQVEARLASPRVPASVGAWFWAVLITSACVLAYSNSLSVPLLLDDEVTIRDNTSLRSLADIDHVLWPAHHVFSSGRPLLNLSFAFNYAAGGDAVTGYHCVNLGIHVLAGLALFALLRRVFQLSVVAEVLRREADGLAAISAFVWATHPLATSSVTYLSQRAEALAAFFFLCTLYAFLRSLDGTEGDGSRWRVLAVCSCWVGVCVKETTVTAPLVVLLFDRAFASHSLVTALRQRSWFYLGLGASWLALSGLMIASHVGSRGIGFSGEIDAWHYAAIEARVIFSYVSLAAWPHPLVFDYGWTPFATNPAGIVFVTAITAVLIAVCSLYYRRPRAGLAPLVFFVLLAPTSSFVPIAAQPMAESRTYLPLAALVVGSVVGVVHFGGRAALLAFTAVTIGLGTMTYRRNLSYGSPLSIWSDTLAKVPQSARAHNNLGLALLAHPDGIARAVGHFREALRLRPEFPEAEYNLALALQRSGDAGQAVEHYQAALRLKPNYGAAHNNLGLLLLSRPGERAPAIEHFRAALAVAPENTEARYNLANALADDPTTRTEAISHYRRVIAARADAPEPHNNLGFTLAQTGDLKGAIVELESALRLKPDYEEARRNLAIVRAAAENR